jgi:hypothetical protein
MMSGARHAMPAKSFAATASGVRSFAPADIAAPMHWDWRAQQYPTSV